MKPIYVEFDPPLVTLDSLNKPTCSAILIKGTGAAGVFGGALLWNQSAAIALLPPAAQFMEQ